MQGLGVPSPCIVDLQVTDMVFERSFEYGGVTAHAAAAQILVVDDDPHHRELVARAISSAGYKAHTAQDGEEGWEALCRVKYTLVITDHEMPRLTGLKLIQRIRAVSESLPCILISGMLPEPEWILKEMVQPGAVLAKPFKVSELLGAVLGLLGRV
jgi:two-component system OmpR family response regulator